MNTVSDLKTTREVVEEIERKLDRVQREAWSEMWAQGRELNELKERIGSLEEEVLREGSMRRKADLKIAELEKKIAKETEERIFAEYDRIADEVRLERTLKSAK